MLGTLLALAGVTAAALVGTATPAAAADCQDPLSVCLVTEAFTVPVGTPAVGPVGSYPYAVPGPRLCDTGTGQCTETYVIVPGAQVGAGGSTLSSITVPSFGIEVGPDTVPTVYYGVPGFDPSSSGLPDVTVVAWVPPVPVTTSGTRCKSIVPIDVVVVGVSGSSCLVQVTVTV